jgi:hypothetical protein
MSGYADPSAVFTVPGGGVKIDPNDPAFELTVDTCPECGKVDREPDNTPQRRYCQHVWHQLPAIYLFSNSRNGDGVAYSMCEDGTVLGSHLCSHWGYMRHDLHDRPDRREACQAHYPGGYRLIVLLTPGATPPDDVYERNQELGRKAKEVSGG